VFQLPSVDRSNFDPVEVEICPVNVLRYPVQSHATHGAKAAIQQLDKCTILISTAIVIIIVLIYCINNISNNNNTTKYNKCNSNESKARNSLYGDLPLTRYKFTQMFVNKQ